MRANQATWLKDPARRIGLPFCTFVDRTLEATFQAAAATGYRRLLSSGLILNALAVALEWRMGGMSSVQSVHWWVSWTVTAILLSILWQYPCACVGFHNFTRPASRIFLAQLIVHLCIGSIASRTLPQTQTPWSWTLVFTTGMCLITGWLGQPSVRSAFTLCVAALVTFYTGLAAHPINAPRATEAALMLGLAVGMVNPEIC